MKKIFAIVLLILIPSLASAQSVDLAQLSAQGVAVYGWKGGVSTMLYQKKQNYLFPIASITKLVTAKAVEALYPATAVLTLSPESMLDTKESNISIVSGMSFSRDDLLRSLLINSNNAVANQFALSAGGTVLMDTMNTFLHAHDYTQTSFINPSGLDPLKKTIKPNRLTPKNLSYLVSDIFTKDPLLTSILETKAAVITEQTSGKKIQLKSSNELNRDPKYDFFVILSKTGNTDMAGEDLVFVTNGGSKFDYVTVVLLHSKNRTADSKVLINWLQRVLASG
jgi:D-alanyl-D-alanine carboxypeptidase